MGNYNYFKLELNSFSIPFTLIAILFLINSFNYFDGLDGVLSFSTISTLGILFFLTPDENIKLFLIIILIPIIFFLFFNFSIFKLPKLFLGDSGSFIIRLYIGIYFNHITSQFKNSSLQFDLFQFQFLFMSFYQLIY